MEIFFIIIIFFASRGVYLVRKELFCQGKGLFLQQGRKIAIKRALFAHVNETLGSVYMSLKRARF